MNRYEDYETPVARQKDLVLSTNEFAFLLDKTNGIIRTYTGPTMLPISQQQALVTFDEKTKTFNETVEFNKAKQLFISAPEGWYIVLKNPAKDNIHPNAGNVSNNPEIEIGKKINISGPTSFSLFPGQMAKVIRGHRLRSNQYLIARVYDAEAASNSAATVVNAEGIEVKAEKEKYFVGQLLVIKGTEVSFYIPPTGIEVLPNASNEYIRDAITLERLEYCILKDENGEKIYKHGPAVIFPKPTETFVETQPGSKKYIFRAMELSPISGIYVKVIAQYTDEDGETVHPVGEELFITGEDQMIYYPRPEHTIIQYDGKYMHHAIAIPEGEGRYILNRLTGDITTVKGPAMYLPDPRIEVVVKRKLSPAQCALWYPGNDEVVKYNKKLNEHSVEAMEKATNKTLDFAYTTNQEKSLALFEASSAISRGTSYTKPRTITLDNRYDGVVSIDVWTGYAINVVSKNGKRNVVVGPQTRLLDYNEDLEILNLSTGKPKISDNPLRTVFLKTKNNKVTDLISVQTKDYVNAIIKLSYSVDFNDEDKDKWFDIDNYVEYLCNIYRSKLKKEIKKYNIQDFYQNSTDIIREIILGETGSCKFTENGMEVTDVDVISLKIDSNIMETINALQKATIENSMKLANAEDNYETVLKISDYQNKQAELKSAAAAYQRELSNKEELKMLENQKKINEENAAIKLAQKTAEKDLQVVLDAINEAELARAKKVDEDKIAKEEKLAEIEKNKQNAYAESIKTIMGAVSSQLAAALESNANADIMRAVASAVSPYAMANGESVADATNTLLRGTSIEALLKEIKVTE